MKSCSFAVSAKLVSSELVINSGECTSILSFSSLIIELSTYMKGKFILISWLHKLITMFRPSSRFWQFCPPIDWSSLLPLKARKPFDVLNQVRGSLWFIVYVQNHSLERFQSKNYAEYIDLLQMFTLTTNPSSKTNEFFSNWIFYDCWHSISKALVIMH